jgi:acetoacetyl-[acyl-carrier protein] synthase
MGRAMAAARALVGETALRRGGFVAAHGTGTPQNRVTEAAILSQVAGAFGVDAWPVMAVKAYLGHSIGSAGGDQVTATLGVWEHGVLPGITTIDGVADDVAQGGLQFPLDHLEVDRDAQAYAIINAKGFGGNNASAALLSPATTRAMLQRRHGERQWQQWQEANEAVRARQHAYDQGMIAGEVAPTYHFDHGVLTDDEVSLDARQVTIGGRIIELAPNAHYSDLALD